MSCLRLSPLRPFPAPEARRPSYAPAQLRGITAIDPDTLTLGVSFNLADGSVSRLLLRTNEIADLVCMALGMRAELDE